jgi:hypothetical protein
MLGPSDEINNLFVGKILLHLPVSEESNNIADVKAKIQYLVNQCPALIHLWNVEGDNNDGDYCHYQAVHCALIRRKVRFNFECLKILCDVDETILREGFVDCSQMIFDKLPLHLFIQCNKQISEVSDEGDCFRLPLRLGLGLRLFRSYYGN